MSTTTPDLRSFLDEIRRDAPEQMLTISEEVPLDYTSTALALALEKQGRAPILLFERLEGHDFSLVANLFASRDIMARGIGARTDTFNERLGTCLDALLPAEHVSDGPVQEVVLEGDAADLGQLPVPRHFTQDAGPYITAGMVAARDPDTGVGFTYAMNNAGFYIFSDPRETSLSKALFRCIE